jgi:hypothetical protein
LSACDREAVVGDPPPRAQAPACARRRTRWTVAMCHRPRAAGRVAGVRLRTPAAIPRSGRWGPKTDPSHPVEVLSEATARKAELTRQAEADRYRLYVQALGSPDAYNKYDFAEGLPPDLRLGVFYAGPGTFWTDLKGFEQAMLGALSGNNLNNSLIIM